MVTSNNATPPTESVENSIKAKRINFPIFSLSFYAFIVPKMECHSIVKTQVNNWQWFPILPELPNPKLFRGLRLYREKPIKVADKSPSCPRGGKFEIHPLNFESRSLSSSQMRDALIIYKYKP